MLLSFTFASYASGSVGICASNVSVLKGSASKVFVVTELKFF